MSASKAMANIHKNTNIINTPLYFYSIRFLHFIYRFFYIYLN